MPVVSDHRGWGPGDWTEEYNPPHKLETDILLTLKFSNCHCQDKQGQDIHPRFQLEDGQDLSPKHITLIQWGLLLVILINQSIAT